MYVTPTLGCMRVVDVTKHISIKKVECNPTCDKNDRLCQAGGQYVDCKLCGFEGVEPCRYSPWCWVPLQQIYPVGELNKYL
jgi:hypothetical protein